MIRPRLFLAFTATAFLSTLAPAASLDVYLSAPGSQSTSVAGASTETFNSLPLGNQTTAYHSAIGTFQFSTASRFASIAANQYGGANGSRYVALGAQSSSSTPVTLTLNNPANYFGFWWSAGDRNNGLSFYYDNTLLARLTTSNIISLLNANQGVVTALDGNKYTKANYDGNPNSHLDSSEPFSYVNIFATGTGFNKIVFDNSGTTGTGFETDNYSVLLGHAKPTGSSVFVQSTPAVAVSLSPEPGTVILAGFGIVGFSLILRRRARG